MSLSNVCSQMILIFLPQALFFIKICCIFIAIHVKVPDTIVIISVVNLLFFPICQSPLKLIFVAELS